MSACSAAARAQLACGAPSLRSPPALLDSRAPFHSVAALRWAAELVVQSPCGCTGALRSEKCGTESQEP